MLEESQTLSYNQFFVLMASKLKLVTGIWKCILREKKLFFIHFIPVINMHNIVNTHSGLGWPYPHRWTKYAWFLTKLKLLTSYLTPFFSKQHNLHIKSACLNFPHSFKEVKFDQRREGHGTTYWLCDNLHYVLETFPIIIVSSIQFSWTCKNYENYGDTTVMKNGQLF